MTTIISHSTGKKIVINDLQIIYFESYKSDDGNLYYLYKLISSYIEVLNPRKVEMNRIICDNYEIYEAKKK